LFEVDEAASRVREEVEENANIIFGATFDESLEGTIRVSVVATGIDQMVNEEASPAEDRMAELTRRLKSVSQQQPAAQAAAAAQAGMPAAGVEAMEEELGIPQMRASANQPQIRRAAGDPSVRIGPFRPDPSLIKGREPEDDLDLAGQAVPETRQPQPFIPAAAERPASVQARMPRVEDFPAIAQRQLHGSAPQAHAEAHEDGRPRGLLARLTHGLARREEEADPVNTAGSDAGRDDRRPAAQQSPQPIAQPASEFAKQPQPRRMGEPTGAAGGLDRQGRSPAAEPVHDDDELEIPAFLRRQSN
jgi:cell division protein FtsZ